MAATSFAPHLLTGRRIPLAEIDAALDARSGATRGLGNSQPACFNRQVAMYLAKHIGKWSTKTVGRYYGGRDHSVALALEYEAVLRRPGLIVRFSEAEIDTFLDYMLSVASLWPSVPRLRHSLRDPDDERILEVAAQCEGVVITHNMRDFGAAVHFGVKIMSPAEVLEALKGSL